MQNDEMSIKRADICAMRLYNKWKNDGVRGQIRHLSNLSLNRKNLKNRLKIGLHIFPKMV